MSGGQWEVRRTVMVEFRVRVNARLTGLLKYVRLGVQCDRAWVTVKA